MKRLLSSLHVTRWLRVVAVAGVVLASGATATDKDGTSGTTGAASYSVQSSRWCMRC